MKKILFLAATLWSTFASLAQSGGSCCAILEINYKDKNVIARDEAMGTAFKFELNDAVAKSKSKKNGLVELDKPAARVVKVNGTPTSTNLSRYKNFDDFKFDLAAIPGFKYSATDLQYLPKYHIDSVDASQKLLFAHNANEKIVVKCGPDVLAEYDSGPNPNLPLEVMDNLALLEWKKPGENSVRVFDIVSRSGGAYGGQGIDKGFDLGSNTAARPNTSDAGKWDSKGNNLPGNTGRLIMDYPKGTTWKINIYTMDDKYIRSFDNTNSTGSFTLSPGEYRIKLNNVTLLNVPVRKGEDTRLRCGVLNIVSDTDWRLFDESGKTYYISGKKADKLLLPVGAYSLKLGGANQPVIIKDGDTTEL